MAIRSLRAYPVSTLTVDASSPVLAAGTAVRNNGDTPDGTILRFDSSQPAQSLTLLDNAGSASRFASGNSDGQTVVEGGSLTASGSRISALSMQHLQQLDALGQPFGPITTITLLGDSAASDAPWGYSATAPLHPDGRYEKVTGSNFGASGRSRFVPCFVTGTSIATQQGLRPVERLRPGDLVMTRDNGYQPLLWLGIRQVDHNWLRASPDLQPVRIAAHTFGPGQPERDLWVSPQHRLLLDGGDCQMLFGEPEVLAAADHLLQRPGLSRQQVSRVTYVHLLFAQHQVVLSNGLWSESFQPGLRLLRDGCADTRREILSLFPELSQPDTPAYSPARMVLKHKESQLLPPRPTC